MMTTNTFGHSETESSTGTEPLWTVDDVAIYLRVNPETVRAMARRGELPSIKVGKRIWRFRISEITDWLKFQHETVETDSATDKDQSGGSTQTAIEKSHK